MFRPGHAPLRSTVPGLFVHDHGHAGPGGTGAWSLRGEVGSGGRQAEIRKWLDGIQPWKAGFMVCIYIYIILYTYLYMGKFHHDLTVLPKPGIMVNKENHPQMAFIQVRELLYRFMIHDASMVSYEDV